MPRAKKPQPPRAASDQAYGVKGEALAAQKAMPLPDNTQQAGAPTSMPQTPPAQEMSMENALAAAQLEGAKQFPTSLGAGSQRPEENVMAPSNLLAGPEIEHARILNEIMAVSTSDDFKGMVNRLLSRKAATGRKPSSVEFNPEDF